MNTKLLIAGCSWTVGEWQLVPGTNELTVSHAGLTEYLSEHFDVVNISRGGSSNWQTCFTLRNYLTYSVDSSPRTIIVGQTDIARHTMSEKYQVDYPAMIKKAENCFELYRELLEIFYIKLTDIAREFNCKIYLTGTITDLDMDILGLYPELGILCPSWIKLLDDTHTQSIIPLIINPALVELCKQNNRIDLCEELIKWSDDKFIQAQQLMETDKFGPAYGDFHPSRIGHKILSDFIVEKLYNET